jgi:flagellar motility protein MotE (MotC chaperone)
MASAVRVLPALIAVSIGALAFKGVDLAQAVAQAVEEGAGPSAAPETDLTAGIGDGAPASEAGEAPPEGAANSAGNAASCLPSLDYAAETGISEQEILVLRSLADRRKTLDEREAGIDTREQAAAAAEARLQEQIVELKSVQGKVETLLTAMDAKRDERMAALVKTYESMKPKDAARIFDSMDDKVLIDLAKSMKPATLAAVMSAMDSKRAEHLTQMLADLAKPPADLDSLQKTSG